MVGILYCSQSKTDHNKLRTILSENHIDASCIAIEDADAHTFEQFSVIINAMDNFYPEGKMDLLVDFFYSGRNIINLSATPFGVDPDDGSTNVRILRSFGIVDDFCPIRENCTYVKTADGKKLDIALTNLHGAVYHLSEQDEDGKLKRCAYIEHILDAYDENDRLVAAPVIRVVTYHKGSMSFFAFHFDVAKLEEDFWKELFLNLVKKELYGNVLLQADCSYARYLPGEPIDIRVNLKSLTFHTDTALSLHASIYDSHDKLVMEQHETIRLPYEATISPDIAASSLYRVVISAELHGITLARVNTGFLVLSDEEITDELRAFKPMYIDESISTDYCLVDGKITAILGTTYFVTDVYRECFYNMNAWLCSKEMAQLKQDGFNVLRSGNWTYIADFYQEDGSLGERGKRALQTYFILAARNGFTVQFALGNVMLNQWDDYNPWGKRISPIHNADMRKKCMTFVRSFAENFKDYPNITLDIVNEPSYSYAGAWTTGRPSGDEGELIRYREWLYEQYHGDIGSLRRAWGESASVIKSFDDITMPDPSLFSRGLCRTEQRYNHTSLTDFFDFARNEFLDWTCEVRKNIKQYAPHMLVIMGRDETLRIPAQQDEVLAGNVDMVCWHQWNYNSNIIYEYLLNRVRGKMCVAQELGMYKFDDIRGGKRHSDEEMAVKLEKKLLYAFGNFVQWQAHDDPFMYELSENSLGLYRADLSPTPSLAATKKLITAEKQMQSYMYHRLEDKVKIATVYNTSYYFSVDNQIAQQGIKNHVYALIQCMKEQSDFIPEHLFCAKNKETIGSPRLIILPAMQTLKKDVWNELLTYVRNGCVLLISGCIDRNACFGQEKKIGALDDRYRTRKLRNFEKIILDDREYVLDFRQIVGYGDVSNMLNCGQIDMDQPDSIIEYQVENGTILYCPYPLELSSNTEAVCALYQYAIQKADAQNEIYHVLSANPNIVFCAAVYEACTVYTLINEGFEDTVTWTDLRSNATFTAGIEADAGCKIWVSSEGGIMQIVGEGRVL